MSIRHDSIANLISGLGTRRDSATQARPTLEHRLTALECKVLWTQNDLARRIVDEVVEDAVRGGWSAYGADGGLLDDGQLRVGTHLRDAGIKARRDGTAFVWMVTDRGGRGTEFPIDDGESPVNLVVFDRDEVTPYEWDNDPRSTHYDQPLTYQITPHNNVGFVEAEYQAIIVHRSRLLRLDGNPLPDELDNYDEGYGDSVLQSVWGAIRNFTQTEQAIANIVQRFETATISIAGLAEVNSSEEGQELLQRRMRLFQQSISMLNAAIVDKDAGEDYTRKFATVNGLDTIWDRLAHSVSKAAKMPMTQLFGMSPSGLSSDDESGKANWRKQVATFQTEQFHDNLVRFYRALHGEEAVEIEFSPLDETTAGEEAEIRERESKTLTAYVQAGILSPQQAREKLEATGYIRDAQPDEQALGRLEDALSRVDASSWRTDPYPTAESVPEHVPADQADKWRKAWNRVFEETGDEGRAFAVANDLLRTDSFRVPESARNNARKVLKWREEHGDEVKGMTEVGWRRARQLATRSTIGAETVKKMAQFARHEKNAEVAAEHKDEPWKDAGYVAWLGWGGTTGIEWAKEISDGL